ncbi:MAG: META domain-containing protein [Rhodobacteraceae bacterium]|nr:META domain-containing protein [Paracoccaceae bacterium]
MKRPWLLILCLSACGGDESVYSYGAANTVWALEQIDGHAVPYLATMVFPKPGYVSGQTPCGSFAGLQTAPYPWFEAKIPPPRTQPCETRAAEDRFFETLAQMTLSEVSGPLLVLSNDAGTQMVFSAVPPDG